MKNSNLKWWKNRQGILPYFCRLLHEVLLVHPASGASERALAYMQRMYGQQQDNAYSDEISLSLIEAYNETAWETKQSSDSDYYW
jgi:hypothetical protein